ncbi:transcriptional regulator [Microlunatus endophyticus]|uniref:Transcriptional regulator n=1 Tax=Microlunatus endophyticus TaxID=1716077 RepID=A0A917W340_9ACTN|nr:YafY family protein [Microlunatus endophyticus]GGL56551.1 transcriptional regulator [Microlunatus endophyticus]
MSRPTGRVLALLEILQAGGTRTVADLADRLGVDERTVRRYVDHLDELGIPVTSVRGRYGGYRLARGYRMPPLMLSDDESLAVVLGLLAGRHAGLLTTPPAATESAIAKIRRVLPDTVRQRLDALIETVGFTVDERPGVSTGTGVLLTLAGAVRDRVPVRIGYRDRSGTGSERTLSPYGVVSHAGRWYVTGQDSASGELRSFRVDRIIRADLLPGSFRPAPAGFDPTAAVLSALARTPWTHQVRIRIRATTTEARRVFPASVASIEDVTDQNSPDQNSPDQNSPDQDSPEDHDATAGWLLLRLQVEDLGWIPGLLAVLDRPFVIEEPDDLREGVRRLADRLVHSADKTGRRPGGTG